MSPAWAAEMFPTAGGGAYSRPGKVFTRFRPEQINGVLQSMNIQFRAETTKSGSPIWLFDLDRFKAGILVFDTNRLRDGSYNAISLTAGFQSPPIDRVALLERVNNWNLGMRFSMAMVAPQGVDLTADVALDGGVTPGTLRERISLFRAALPRFLQQVVSSAPAPGGGPLPGPAPAPFPAPTPAPWK